jgi:phosphoglycerate dehydrogenase-like enzyme
MTRVLALDPFHDDGLALLRARDDVDLVYLPTPTDAEIAQHLPEAEVLLLRSRTIPVDVYQTATNLRLVSRHGVGCDNLDFDQMRAMGVTIAVSADANLISVAEHAFMLMLAACKKVMPSDRAVRNGGWAQRDHLGTRDVAGSAVLTVGYGRIGRAFAARAQAFGARVSFYDPFLPSDTALPDGITRAPDLAEAVARADIVSLHIPFSETSAGLFDAAMLARFQPGTILVNTARGGIVDEGALLAALDAGRPALYAADVMLSEPPGANDPLFSRDDVILTPHSAATTAQAMVRMAIGASRNALDFLDGILPHSMIALDPSEDTRTTP